MKPKTLHFHVTEEAKKKAMKYTDKVIKLLKPLPVPMKWLVIQTLYESFPREQIEEYHKKETEENTRYVR